MTAAVDQPRVLHARGFMPKGSAEPNTKVVVLAEVVVERGVAAFDGAVLDGVEHLETGNDFAGREGLDLEFVVASVQRRVCR